ncbi:hypothetical protein Ddye_009575 [Dipteronia dyeriana]|uniref:RING-type E3 ubiquitin transferase n=1 Tax=Dipteronia dyeriana TaxID=168575 RepID=A0AAD9XBV1_9ROSI|nr:hypothetical protein Ddye_009575 [Dipteronia dyeriana]
MPTTLTQALTASQLPLLFCHLSFDADLFIYHTLSLFSTSHFTWFSTFRIGFEFQNLMREPKLNLSRWIMRGFTWTMVLFSACHYAAAQPVTTKQPPDRESSGFYSNFDPSMAIVILVLVAVFFLVSVFSIYVRNCVDLSPATEVLPGVAGKSRGLDSYVIESFPLFIYSAVKDLKMGRGALECAVCLSEFGDDDTLRLLPKCDHVFHHDCIDAWLDFHVTCPVCRANLTPEKSNEAAKSTESINELTQNNSASEPSDEDRNISNEQQNSEVVQVQEIENANASHVSPKKNRSPRSRVCGKFPRSHSTGHSLVQPGMCMERYTLRLPEEIRKQIIMSGKIKRAMSFNLVLANEGSSRKGGGEGSGRGRSYMDRWVFSKTPPFVSRKDGDGSTGRSLFTAVKSPLNCLSVKVEKGESSSIV